MTARIAVLIVLCARAVAAQPSVDHFNLGVTLFKEGNYAAALAEFEASYKLQANPGILYNIGLAHQRLFHVTEALDALRRFLEDPSTAADKRASAEAIIADLEKLLAPITFRLVPASARLTIDDRPVDASAPVKLPAGKHRIAVEADGHRGVRREITVAAGVEETHELTLEALPTTGRVRVTASVERAMVTVDDRPRGEVPLELELSPGHHVFDFAAHGFREHRAHLDVAAGGAHEVVGTLARRPGKRWYKRWYVWVPVGVLAVGATVFAVGGDGFIDGTLGGKRL